MTISRYRVVSPSDPDLFWHTTAGWGSEENATHYMAEELAEFLLRCPSFVGKVERAPTKVAHVCNHCGGTNLVHPATAYWSTRHQKYELMTVAPSARCATCETSDFPVSVEDTLTSPCTTCNEPFHRARLVNGLCKQHR